MGTVSNKKQTEILIIFFILIHSLIHAVVQIEMNFIITIELKNIINMTIL